MLNSFETPIQVLVIFQSSYILPFPFDPPDKNCQKSPSYKITLKLFFAPFFCISRPSIDFFCIYETLFTTFLFTRLHLFFHFRYPLYNSFDIHPASHWTRPELSYTV